MLGKSSRDPVSLRDPNHSLDDELTRLRAHTGYGYLFFTACVVVLAILEGWGYFFGLPGLPLLFAGLVAIVALGAFIHIRRGRASGRSNLVGNAGRLPLTVLE